MIYPETVVISFMKRMETELGSDYALDLPGIDFDSVAQAEWLEARDLGYTPRPSRDGEKVDLWTFQVNCYDRGPTMWRIIEMVDDVDATWNQHDLAVRNWDEIGDPVVGWLRCEQTTAVAVPASGARATRTADLSQVAVTIRGSYIE